MRPIRSISVLMPTWQGMEFLERVLRALAAQRVGLPWDFRVIDSGSTDGTWELLQAWRERLGVPVALERIHQVEFDHGDTRNLLAARSRGDLLVFLTQDAIPGGPEWLADLAANFEDPAVGGAYCRNVPRPDALPATRVLCAQDPGYATGRKEVRLPEPEVYARATPEERRMLYNFQDVASAVRREFWERHPFPRANFGEDVLMARALLEAGLTVVYDDRAVVEHSHDYDARETYSRAHVDARFNLEWLGRRCLSSERDVSILVQRCAEQDRRTAAELGLAPTAERELLREVGELRRAAFRGLLDGGESERRHAPTRARADGRLRLLYVVHGFPPDTWAGTEIYTLNLAREMQRRGHEVAVFARVPGTEGGPPDFHVEAGSFEDLRVLRMTHRLQHGSLRESYLQPRAEAAFARVLLAEAPDVVHFQHLIHSSVGLVRVAREAGCATVVTCHDYWALCPRVQLIRPDGAVCPSNMGSGCYACIKENGLDQVERLARLDARTGAALPELARVLEATEVTPARARALAAEYRQLREREQLVPQAYADCDLRISPSRFLRERHLDSGHFDPHGFLYSANGMRTDHVQALRKSPRPAGRVRLGFVGSLVWYKGGELLVRAMRRLAGRDVELAVHGSFDPQRDPHHAELQRLARGARVTFHGRFDNSRLSEVYRDLDVLVVPSLWYENAPITIQEAHLTGTPVVTAGFGGMAEFVRDGVDGLHFEPGDDADLARVLARFLDEPDLLERLSQDFPTVKTLEQNGEEMEFRYRGLACRERQVLGGPRVLLEADALETAGREGPAEQQDADLLLLRPGGSAAEYELGALLPGPVRLCIELRCLPGEEALALGGRVLVDGTEVGRIEPFHGPAEGGSPRVELDAELPPDVRRLRVEPRLSAEGPELHLRLRRLAVTTVPAGATVGPESHP